MAWAEVASKRNQRSRTYQEDNHFRWSGTLATLHYESQMDSGIFDAPIDATPVRVNVASFDGWRVVQNGWHYALGRDLLNHGTEDGWVGFGGRQGAHWLKFRLLRTGYLHWPTRDWTNINPANPDPNYARTNLSSQANTLSIGPNADPVVVGSVASWNNLWTTLGGGALSVRWRVDGDRLKEEIVINQAGRDWIRNNRPPSTPLAETWFGFVFRVDWSDLPRVKRAGQVWDKASDIADDGEIIELHDHIEDGDVLLGFMPIDNVYVVDAGGDILGHAQLRKRFWHDADGNDYLAIGVRCDVLNGLPAGDLIFDPSVNEQVGASSDDAAEDSGSVNLTGNTINPYSTNTWAGFRFTTVNVAGGVTIDTTTNLEPYFALFNDLDGIFSGEDADNPGTFTTAANNISGRTRTTANVRWINAALPVPAWRQSTADSINFAAIIQEIIDRPGWAADNAIVIVCQGQTGSDFGIRSYDWDTGFGCKLNIDYTAGGGTEYPQSVAGALTLAGIVAKRGGKPIAGTLTTAGTVALQIGKSLAGALSSAGIVVKSVTVSVSGTLTSAGAVAKQTILSALTGTLTSAGTLAARGQKALGGTLTSAGEVAKQAAINLAGTLSTDGAVTAVKTALMALAGTLSMAGTVALQAGKGLAGTLTTAGALTKQIILSALTGTLSSSGALNAAKIALISLAGTLTSAGTLTLRTGKALTGALSSAGIITRTINKSLAGILTSAGAVGKGLAQAVAGTLNLAGVLTTIYTAAGAIAVNIGIINKGSFKAVHRIYDRGRRRL